MRRSAIAFSALAFIGLFVAQAALLQVTQRLVLLGAKATPVYIFEGDLVSETPPANAQEASHTVRETWSSCRYWTGLWVKKVLVPAGNCPSITL
jgi:hypothetical protein